MTADLLSAYRARLALSQSQMAARWGVPLRTYQKLEQGDRRADDAVLIGLLRDLLA